VSFTLLKSPEPLSKRFDLEEGGGIVKIPAANMTQGRARRVLLDFAQFGAALTRAGEREAFCYGLHDAAAHGEAVQIAIAAKADPARGVLARTREFFDYRPGPGVVMIDHDPHPDGPAVTPEALRDILAAVCPAFAGAACWVRGSLSAGVHLEGEAPKPGRGFHLYLAAADAADIPRFGRALFRRLWLAGHGYIALSGAGSFLVRAVIDEAVFAGERLDFTGCPIVGPGLAYAPPEAVYHTGGYLDTFAQPDLSEAEERQFAAVVAQAKQAREGDRQAQRARWEENHIRAMASRGVSERGARAQARQIPADGKPANLHRDWPLEFAALGSATVGEVLANPSHYDGQALADPIEGVGYGRTTAKFFANPGGKPYIHSHAHGGAKYFLKASAAPPPRPPEPPFDPAYYAQMAPQAEEESDASAPAPAAAPRPAFHYANNPAQPATLAEGGGVLIEAASRQKAKPAPRRGLAGGLLQDPGDVGRRPTPPTAKPGKHPRAHAARTMPAQAAQPTNTVDFAILFAESNLHAAYTGLHPSYTDRLNEYSLANGLLLEADDKGNQALVAESRAADCR
jgi:hypothetical protein